MLPVRSFENDRGNGSPAGSVATCSCGQQRVATLRGRIVNACGSQMRIIDYPPIIDRYRHPHSIPGAGCVDAARVPRVATGILLHEEGEIAPTAGVL